MTDTVDENPEPSDAIDETQAIELPPAKYGRPNYRSFIYTFIILLLLAEVLIAIDRGPEIIATERACRQLRMIGSAQLAYQSGTNVKVYGSLEALRACGDLPEDATHTTLIQYYSLSWDHAVPDIRPDFHFDGGVLGNHFTVIAFPDNRDSLNLYTFAITEDQVIRRYDPSNGNQLDEVQTWDPVIEP